MLPADLPTPAALIDVARLSRNIARMQAQADRLGVRLRPHVKTHKCLPVAQLQRAAGAQDITVSTLKEAEAFFAAGFEDILYAVCIAPAKLAPVRRLREQGCRLTVLVDSLAAARALVAEPGHAFDVMIEIDSDGHRAGVLPDDPLLLEIGHVLHEGGARLLGVMTHAGESYALNTPEALAALAEQERARCVDAAERLRAAGLPCAEVSVGSTPTALAATQLQGVTELRAGVYALQDLVMANVGICTPDEIALSVLTTVIGHQAGKGWLLTDAGWMALSRDRGTQKQSVDYGYGAVCDEAGQRVEGLLMSGANQEHGILSWHDGRVDATMAARWPIGTRLRILPNHACATGAQFPQYHALRPDGDVQIWERFHGW